MEKLLVDYSSGPPSDMVGETAVPFRTNGHTRLPSQAPFFTTLAVF